MTEITPNDHDQWSKLDDVTVIDEMLADASSEHWKTCCQYIHYRIKRHFPKLTSESQNEAVQEAMLSVHKNLPTFRRKCPFTMWLNRVARTRGINEIRKQKVLLQWETSTEHSLESNEDTIERPLVDQAQTPEQALLAKEQEQELLAAIEDFLKPSDSSEHKKAWYERNKKILQMVMLDGYGIKEAAQKLGIPAPNVGYMVRSVRKHLRKNFSHPPEADE